MHYSRAPDWIRWLGLAALLVFPATVVVLHDTSGAVFALLALVGIAFSIHRSCAAGWLMHPHEKLFFISVCLAFPAALLTAWVTGTEIDNADRFLILVLSIPLYFVFRYTEDLDSWVWWGLVAGAVITAAVALYQVSDLYYPSGQGGLPRARGSTHPIIFGDLSLSMGLLPLSVLIGRKRVFPKFLIFAGLIGGLVASLLSKSRGGWLAAMPVLAVYFWFFSRVVSLKKILSVFALFLCVLVAAYFIPSTGLQQRVDVTVDNLSRYFESVNPTDPIRGTSVGLRFEMWKSAWQMFLEQPITGGGWDQFRKFTQGMVAAGGLHPSAEEYAHPHNQFLSSLAKGGLLSLISLLALFFVPAWVFYRGFRLLGPDPAASMALSGLILIVLYMGFGMSEAILERTRPVLFFTFYLAVFMGRTMRAVAEAEEVEDQGRQ